MKINKYGKKLYSIEDFNEFYKKAKTLKDKIYFLKRIINEGDMAIIEGKATYKRLKMRAQHDAANVVMDKVIGIEAYNECSRVELKRMEEEYLNKYPRQLKNQNSINDKTEKIHLTDIENQSKKRVRWEGTDKEIMLLFLLLYRTRLIDERTYKYCSSIIPLVFYSKGHR